MKAVKMAGRGGDFEKFSEVYFFVNSLFISFCAPASVFGTAFVCMVS
jgi:hypothetical protein